VRRFPGSVVLLALLPLTLSAQEPTAKEWADSVRRVIDAAAFQGKIEPIAEARALAERALTRFPDDAWLHHYRGYALYREANLRTGLKGDKNIDQVLREAESAFRTSAAKQPIAESYALLSSVIGQQIGSNPIKGMTLGPRSNDAMDKAIELAPRNPRVWLVRGISAMFTPGMFGGGNDRAEEYLRRAISFFDGDQPQTPAPSWGRAEAWGWLGQVLAREERFDDARAAYLKSLEIEPANGWVREQLLPALEKQAAKRK
jgi:tetratricopeptide (TPR) repeat protein